MRIASVKTMWPRFATFSTTVFPNIVDKVSKYVDKICIVIDQDNADAHLQNYLTITTKFNNVDVLVGNTEYNVLNKEICPLQKYRI